MIPFKLDGNRYNLPTCWEDTTVRQFKELKKLNDEYDYITFLSILTGVPYETLFNTRSSDVIDKLEPFLAFTKTQLQETGRLEELKIGENYYKVPTDIKKCTYGQKISTWTALLKAQDESGDPYMAIDYVTAAYLQPIVTGEKYSSERAQKFAEEVVNGLSIVPIYHTFTFFLNSLNESRKQRELPYPLNKIKTKWLRGLITSTYLKKSIRLMRLQGEIY